MVRKNVSAPANATKPVSTDFATLSPPTQLSTPAPTPTRTLATSVIDTESTRTVRLSTAVLHLRHHAASTAAGSMADVQASILQKVGWLDGKRPAIRGVTPVTPKE